MTAPPPERRRLAFWLSVTAATVLLAAGVLVTVLGYTGAPSGPDDAVRGYFAALAASDAPTALAYGDVPSGPHALLTTPVLREQQRIAPITGVRIGTVGRHGSHASVAVSYRLGFPGAPQPRTDTVGVHRAGGRWRLDAVAVATQLHLPAAAQRAMIVGGPVPTGDTLLFPGAVPISFDTPLLALRPDDDAVGFDSPPAMLVFVQVSAAGRRAVADAVRASLVACYGPQASARALCPQPSTRYVPGGLRGTPTGSLADEITVNVQSEPSGVLLVSGRVRVQGSFRRLTFTNQVQAGSGMIVVPVQGSAYPVSPLHIRWVSS